MSSRLGGRSAQNPVTLQNEDANGRTGSVHLAIHWAHLDIKGNVRR